MRNAEQQRQEDFEDQSDQDSDDEDSLAARLQDVDLDNSDQIWSKLTEEERADFKRMLQSGEIATLVPDNEKGTKFWWQFYRQRELVIDVIGDDPMTSLSPELPKIEPISKDVVLPQNSSPLVKFNLINVLFAYAFAYRFCNRNVEDEDSLKFVDLCLKLSKNLSKSENFANADLALESASMNANQDQTIKVGRDFCDLVKKDVFDIVRGPGEDLEANLYISASLSDLIAVFNAALHETNSKPNRKQIKTVIKKLDFYRAWSDKNYHEFSVFQQ